MEAKFKKLKSGAWGVRVTGAHVRAGQSIPVTRRDGHRTQVIVSRVLWQGDHDGQPAALVSLRRSAAREAQVSRARAMARAIGGPKPETKTNNYEDLL